MKLDLVILPMYQRGFLLAATALSLLGCGPRDETGVRAAHDDQKLALLDIHGDMRHAFNDEDAKATVLVFTMQDCPIANSYIPALNEFYQEYDPRGVRLLLVHVDPIFTDDAARKHADDYHVKAPVIVDRHHAWVKLAVATRSPQAVVFSPAGEILYSGRIDDKYVGFGKRRTHVTAHDLKDALDAILAGQPVPKSNTEAIGCYIPTLPTGE
jgi:hypothetical protein